MKSGRLPGSFESFSRTRRALAQPRFLLATMALAISGVAYLATAQGGRAPVKMTSSTSSSKQYSLKDLPAMVASYGASRQPKANSTGGFSASAIGTGQSGYSLVESDLTPNTPSDEREAATSPGGDFIAFMSTGKDANNDGKIDSDGINAERRYHIWVMNRDGSNQHQVTGLTATDKGVAQSHPSWSPDGNQLVYVNEPGANSQLYVVDLRDPSYPNEKRTFFTGEKRTPVWSPSGLSIAFACRTNADGDKAAASNQFDLFAIPPTGGINPTTSVNDNLVRLTGGKNDPVGNTTQDLNPTYAVVNTDVMYFSSDRDVNGRLNIGRRIWRMTSGGASKVPVTDPTKRYYSGTQVGEVTDIDDYPTVSLDDTITERLAFQSNTALSPRDKTEGARDYNIWAIQLSSVTVAPGFAETEPRVFASDYDGNQLQFADPLKIIPNTNPSQPITGLNAPEGVKVRGQYVYVANRGSNQIVRFDQETGQPAAAPGRFGISFTDPDSVKDPAGMIADNNFFYVASGLSSTGTANTQAISKFSATTGNAAGLVVNNVVTPAFSNGDTGKVTNGVEGLAFDPANQYIYASAYSDNQVNVYARDSGTYVETIVLNTVGGVPNPNAPLGPTGLAFGPDLNGDGYLDLYVNSSRDDRVLVYMGPRPRFITQKVGDGTQDPGTFIQAIVTDNDGANSNLNAPEGIHFAQIDAKNWYMYVSSFQNAGFTGGRGTGDHINRYKIRLNGATPTAPVPPTVTSAPTAKLADPVNIPKDAIWIQFSGANGIGYFDFNNLASDTNLATGVTPQPTPTPIPATSLEGQGAALVVTNILSSPENYESSGLTKSNPDNVGQDKANDLEPNFSRNNATAPLAARLVFSSTRRYVPAPSSNIKDANGKTPAPSNPYGYNPATGAQGTYDIWGTATQDTTPPALIPQSAGNQLYPVVAPSPDAPFNAPRTYEAGLRASTSTTKATLTLAVVLSDLESGVNTASIANGGNNAVTASFYQAGTEQFMGYNAAPFTPRRSNVDNCSPAQPVQTAIEQKPKPVTVAGASVFPLQPYDDGPPSVGGHERQAAAVAGDGIYYCVAVLQTPTTAGDYYIDVSVTDQVGNPFLYDNIWGFSTQPFQKAANVKSDLFVSDYTCGQNFPVLLVGDSRFADMYPVESYWLTNPGGQVFDANGKQIAASTPTTLANVDVWRTMCRGPVPTTVFDSYRPRTTLQIDPKETKAGPDGPFTAKTRNLAVSDSAVMWAAPYAGTVFTGPGTIMDAGTQTNLTAFLESGGRLFLSGRDIARSLTNDGQVTNDFLQNEMAANFQDEVATNLITHLAGDFQSNVVYHDGDLANLEIPYNYTPKQVADFTDAALNQSSKYVTIFQGDVFGSSVGYYAGDQMDVFTAQAGPGIDTTPAYSAGGGLVGQRIEKTRTNGLKSRAVFFGFGFEAVNRRYRNATSGNPLIALDARVTMVGQIRQYFTTGSLSGTVTNSGTNLPIPNFLVLITGGGETYLARTDANGNYELSGLPPGGYGVQPALLRNGVLVPAGTAGATTSPGGFFGGTAIGASVSGGRLTTGANLQLTPLSPGSIQGRIVTSNGTANNFDDDVLTDKSVGVPVLLRSVDESSAVKNGGHFAALTKTDSSGKFSFLNVPSQINLELIINPNVDDPTTTTVDENDIPIESDLRKVYASSSYGGPRTNIGRRIIPDARHPEPLVAPVGNAFVVNDPDPTKYPNPDSGPAAGSADTDVAADSGIPIVVPEGFPVTGYVKLNAVVFSGATIELLKSNGQPFTPARSTTTAADGTYAFNDVIPGTYQLRATATVNGVSVTKTTSFTQNPKTATGRPGARVNFSLFLAQVNGLVTLNGAPASKVLVKLYYPNGNVFRPERKATTGTDGRYVLTYVPAGSYVIKAVLGAATGTANVTVSATQNTTAPTIKLVSREVTGSVTQSTNGAAPVALPGVTINLLNSSGVSVASTTTDSSGNYKFAAVSAGTYSIRATYQGQVKDSASFTVSATTTVAPTITFYAQSLRVTVQNNVGTAQAGANLSLTSNGAVVQTGTTDSSGKFTFTNVPGGTYKIVATFNDLRGEATVTVTDGQAPPAVTIKMAKDSTGSTTYSGQGKIFYISIPYEDGNSPSSNNGANLPAPATTSIQSAFTVPPFDSNGQQNYLLQRYDATTNQLVTLDNNSSIERGAGYILQVLNKGTNQKLPANDPTRVALTNPTYDKTYTVTLRLNPSNRGTSINGRNLIGFGFDPARFSSVDWATASVTHPNGTTVTSIAAAANKGWLVNQITTSQYVGTTLTTVAVDKLKPFVGYYVQTNVDGLKITFKNPTAG